MIILKVILSFTLVMFCIGCGIDSSTPNIENNYEVEDTTPPEVEDTTTPEVELEVDNPYHELLLSYVFINVTNTQRVTLPTKIMNEEIIWMNNNAIVTSLTGINETYYLNASIGNYNKNFNITFSNGNVSHIYQQDLKFYYNFISDPAKLGTSMSPNKIVLHNTGNTASALNEVLYLNSSSNYSSTSFHFAVDDIGIYQAVPTNIYAHHAGNLAVNKVSIGVEIAKSLSTDNAVKDKAISNGQKLIRLLQMQHNIDDLITHYDVTGKYCPHDIMDRYGLTRFYNELKDSYTNIK